MNKYKTYLFFYVYKNYFAWYNNCKLNVLSFILFRKNFLFSRKFISKFNNFIFLNPAQDAEVN